MKILEYLQKKYRMVMPTSITKAEATAFGIPYPISSGWLDKHGSREIPEYVFKDLGKKLGKRLKAQTHKNKIKGMANTKSGLAVIESRFTRKAEFTKNEKAEPKEDFLRSYEWRKLRLVILKKYGAKCQCCGATPASGAVMNVDHIKPRKYFPELALEESNLQILCGDCNHGKGNWDQTDFRGVQS